ncbi:uncharacterized protein MYCFIDRAFT_195433 [Pseudocercospora fijiensis CIRAD86]|uniref:Dystroglycan-type cadherin-like domain-containing protein n=1 Tax=Pseudocercospora fijiensis (strain CIRAD86) TaxID=383855 RepID=M3B4R7_PSEFD|nr:uncharacterized protein MYCFIDRAFT_195433 [Pseudocercospora fijiensis CIRAD86]EME84368.1 hypothetical protein MYCFIDRAFT_195433 [Pseudocercospora fijiensis CIRAD86]
MAVRAAQILARVSCTLCALFEIAAAIPNVAFPFNSQVPTVARINQPYTFQISASTFAPDAANYVYSLAGQPAWLTINSATRTLTGTPGTGDAGSKTFNLLAGDSSGAATMECTLVVSVDPAPQLTGDVSRQLAESANLSSSEPPVVTLVPSTAFNFDFTQESFIDIIQRRLYYYATLSDHTPLPSWLKFDSERLTFSGIAPDLSAFPQSWDINLIASDVAGFSGTYASFTIAIGTQQLVFVPEEQEVNITAGDKVNITVLQNELFSSNVNISPADLKDAEAEIPAWLHFNASTLAITGTAPVDFSSANISVTATDKQGNMATAIINLTAGNASLFEGQIGTLSAAAGESFTYHFDDSLFSRDDLELAVSLPASADWLKYNKDTRALEGDVPSSTQASTIKVTLTAKLPDDKESQTQTFTIDVKAVSVTTSTASNPTQTNTHRDVEKGHGASEDVPPSVPPKENDPPPQITLNFAPNPARPKSRWLKRISRNWRESLGNLAKVAPPRREVKSIRLVARSDSIKDDRPIDLKRQSFIRNRASTNIQSPLFTHGSRASSNNTRQTGEVSAKNSTAGSARRGRRGKSMLTMYSESSSVEPQHHHLDSPHRDSRRFSQKIRTAFRPNFPRAVTKSTLYDEAGGASRASRAITDSSGDWTSDSLNSQDWITELSKPRQERTFVLPGEASPTPPPPSAPPTSRQQSRQATPDVEGAAVPNSAAERLKQRALKKQLRERSSSPLSQNVQVINRSSPSVIRKMPSTRRNRLSEPLSLVSADSMHKGRPRMGNARRPVSVEEVQRLSSMRAEHDAATTAGSERDPCWLTEESDGEDIRGAGLIPPLGGSASKGNTMRSDLSGPAFL